MIKFLKEFNFSLEYFALRSAHVFLTDNLDGLLDTCSLVDAPAHFAESTLAQDLFDYKIILDVSFVFQMILDKSLSVNSNCSSNTFPGIGFINRYGRKTTRNFF